MDYLPPPHLAGFLLARPRLVLAEPVDVAGAKRGIINGRLLRGSPLIIDGQTYVLLGSLLVPVVGWDVSGEIAPPGQQVFTSSGTFDVPAGVTSISAVAVGDGGNVSSTRVGGRGGDLRWASSIEVTPNESLTVTISTSGGACGIYRSATPLLVARGGNSGTSTSTGGSIGGGNGGNGGSPNSGSGKGGGGAGGYSGAGGAGASITDGSAGSGGGGGGGSVGNPDASTHGGAGGGVGLLGAGSNGSGGVYTGAAGNRGGGGSSGQGGSGTTTGGNYGGGGGGRHAASGSSTGGPGAVRIIWGDGRAYPSTNTGDV